MGLKNVYQLDGGILRYLEENGSAHFDGACFVFDMRMAVDGELRPTSRSADPSQSFGRHVILSI
jgi:predicted sulfurtransferase